MYLEVQTARIGENRCCWNFSRTLITQLLPFSVFSFSLSPLSLLFDSFHHILLPPRHLSCKKTAQLFFFCSQNLHLYFANCKKNEFFIFCFSFSLALFFPRSNCPFPQGVRFDPNLPQTIRLEFAKTNTKVSKPKLASPPAAALPHHSALLHPFTGRKYLILIFLFWFFCNFLEEIRELWSEDAFTVVHTYKPTKPAIMFTIAGPFLIFGSCILNHKDTIEKVLQKRIHFLFLFMETWRLYSVWAQAKIHANISSFTVAFVRLQLISWEAVYAEKAWNCGWVLVMWRGSSLEGSSP